MKKILVIRNDKIGDFMLTWPAFAMLKQAMPKVEITALVPLYTKALAEMCPFIDSVLIDCGRDAEKANKLALVKEIKSHRFDASICFFSDGYNASLVWKANIPFRLAPATKWCQFFYNHRVLQRRSLSLKPEYQYNIDLVSAFLTKLAIFAKSPKPPYLHFDEQVLLDQKDKLAQTLSLSTDIPWLFVHAGSGGSANHLSLEQYRDLLFGICNKLAFELILTAGPKEEEIAMQLKTLLDAKQIQAKVYSKNEGLIDFTRSIACADAFIAGSTGPLHIAGTIDVPTIGFFPAKKSATPLRWQTINSEGRHLAFSPPSNKDKNIASDMSLIKIDKVIPDAIRFLTKFASK